MRPYLGYKIQHLECIGEFSLNGICTVMEIAHDKKGPHHSLEKKRIVELEERLDHRKL